MPARRPFTLFDAMVLIAAVAVAIAYIRWMHYLPAILDKLRTKYVPDGILRPPEDGTLADLASCLLAPLSAAILALRLRQPRPRRHRLLFQPGFVACGSACLVISILAVEYGIEEIPARFAHARLYFFLVDLTDPQAIAVTILAVWGLIAGCGRWRPEASWIDRAGRGLGISWIAMAVLAWLRWPVS